MKKRLSHSLIVILTLTALALSACGQAPTSLTPDPEPAPVFPPLAGGISTALPSETALPIPSPAPSIAPSPTPVPHPLSIESMRARDYPGSQVTIELELDPGRNYKRYYASYLSEGLKIYALLTVPEGQTPATGWPVIVFNHGYIPPDVYRTTERYVAYVDSLASNGYIVFRPDYRGHDQSEGEARGAYGQPDYVIDVLNAVSSMKQFPGADLNRIGMWGHSMGGYIALRSMVITDDIKVGVIWAGVVASYPDLIANWRRPPASIPVRITSWRSSLAEIYGTPEENPEFWASISANSFLADLSGPVQLHHGTADTDVPVAFSETLYQQILGANKYVELYTYPDDNHNISNYFNTAMQRTIIFFDTYLKQ